MSISKIGITATLVILLGVNFGVVLQLTSNGVTVYDVDIYTPLIKGLTLVSLFTYMLLTSTYF